MDLASPAIKNKAFSYFLTVLFVLAGIGSYFVLGQLEDPVFTVKQAAIIIPYPGASPEEVEQEVTEIVERKLQELQQVKYIKSMSAAGYSRIDFYILPHYRSHEIPQVFDEIRRKVNDVIPELPPGAGTPIVADDVGLVFGFLLAVVGEGFEYRELRTYVDDIKRELSLVDGASRVDLWGVQEEVIYVDVPTSQVAELGISAQTFLSALSSQNEIVPAGTVNLGQERLRFEATGAFRTPEEIANLTFRASAIDRLGRDPGESPDTLVRLGDFATITRGYREPPTTLMRFNGQPAMGVAVAVVDGANVVHVGERLTQRVEELKASYPVGIELEPIAWQSELVEESVNNFVVSLIQAIVIVLVILWIFMGLGNALIVGTALIMTILATMVAMAVWGIDLQRMSLGALVIALGMMVDNAIVVADGASVRIQSGMERVRAAVEAARLPAVPLLGATLIAVAFFYPIYASPEDTGEYCESLFQVVALSLLLSWVVSMTVTPLQCVAMLKVDESQKDADPYSGRFYKLFEGFLRYAIKLRWATMLVLVTLLGLASVGFQNIPRLFFPDSSRLQFMVDYWAPEGTRIEQVSSDLRRLEAILLEDERIEAVSAFIGGGPPRFYLPVEPERNYSSYAQLIVNFKDFNDLPDLERELRAWSEQEYENALVRVRRYAVGPGHGFKFEARISGPGSVDPVELRGVAEQAVAILHSTPLAKDVRTDWRTRTKKVVAEYDQARGRWTEIARTDMARGLQSFSDGLTAGFYRENEKQIPIVLRSSQYERERPSQLESLQLSPAQRSSSVPLAQVADLRVETEDPLIWRRDRRRTITVQAEPNGVTLSQLRDVVVPDFYKLDLPPGYTLEWGAEHESTVDSQKALLPGLLPALISVATILVGLFNAYRPPLIIALMVPFALIGVSAALFVTQQAFGFMAVLGAMSLIGMMIKNAIVLLDETGNQLELGQSHYRAVVNAAKSRLRPVAMAAATTVLGVVPLLQDVFWVSMALVIMGGLTFGTVLTMVGVPVLYSIFYRVDVEDA